MKNKSSSIKKFIFGVAVVSLLFGGFFIKKDSFFSKKQNNNFITSDFVSFENAREDWAKRQNFLNRILKDYTIPYCSGVFYDHEGKLIVDYVKSELFNSGLEGKSLDDYVRNYASVYIGGDFDAKTPEIFELSGEGRHSKIFIGRKIFGNEFNFLTENDLIAMIVGHEGRHVQQHAEGFSYYDKYQIINGLRENKIRNDVLYLAMEHDAEYRELSRILLGEFDVSNYYKNLTTLRAMQYSQALIKFNVNAASSIEEGLIFNAHQSVFRDLILQDIKVDESFYQRK